MKGLEHETLAHLRRATARAAPPRIRAPHLPPARPQDPLAGAGCALELDDGTLGLSYMLYGHTLARLQAGAAGLAGGDALALAADFCAAPAPCTQVLATATLVLNGKLERMRAAGLDPRPPPKAPAHEPGRRQAG